MIPIEKNIIVVDEQGNEYEATYLKRAKGLVKNGRARFIDERTICLACPPDIELEDERMSENKELTMSYLLNKMEEISKSHTIETAISSLEKMQAEAQITAVAEIVKARELTNQKLIALYEKMYEDLTAREGTIEEIAMMALVHAADDEGKLMALCNALDVIRDLKFNS